MNKVLIQGFEIPVIEPFSTEYKDYDFLKIRSEERVKQLLTLLKDDLIEALVLRKRACLDHLKKHLETAYVTPFSTGHVEYTYKDGHVGQFNDSSYRMMEKAIDLLQNNKFNEYLKNTIMLEQTIKAYMNMAYVPAEKIVEDKAVPFSQVVSLLVEVFAGNIWDDKMNM